LGVIVLFQIIKRTEEISIQVEIGEKEIEKAEF
jgi:hypothetical protein